MSDDTLVSRTIKRILDTKLVAWIVIPVIITTAMHTALKTGIDIKNTFEKELPPVRIMNVVTGERCLWSAMKANTSRGDQFNAARMGMYELNTSRYPLYTGQISLNNIPKSQQEKALNEYTIDPIFDILLLNNSNDVVVITSVTFIVEKGWSEPKAMPKGGRLEIQDMITIQTKQFSGFAKFTTMLKDPIYLPPKTPYRFLTWVKDLDKNTPENELLVKISLDTSIGSIETEDINLSFI